MNVNRLDDANGTLRDTIEESEVHAVSGDEESPIFSELQKSNFPNETPVSKI